MAIFPDDNANQSHHQLLAIIQREGRRFRDFYFWLEQAMPIAFFEDIPQENILLITYSLMGFHLQDYFSTIHLRHAAIALCLDSPEADLRLLREYALYGIKNYQAYVSKSPPPVPGATANLRIGTIHFTQAVEKEEEPLAEEQRLKLRAIAMQRNSALTEIEFDHLIGAMNSRFLRSLSLDLLILALDMCYRARTRDNCQYEVRYYPDWDEYDGASMQIVLAWRNTPKYNFLYRMARVIHRHGLAIRRFNATYSNPFGEQNILIMALSLHGSNGQAAWDVANLPDFLRELITLKYFASFDLIDHCLVDKRVISGNQGNLLRAMINFIHQALVHLDPNLYTVENIEEALCRHPELTAQLCEAFKFKFDPDLLDFAQYEKLRTFFLRDVHKLDTGQEEYDLRRKNVLLQGMNFVQHTLKTNFYRHNFTALSFRLDPSYLDQIPFNRAEKFPELPYAIFFIKGMHFFAFHIRFKDLARGGVRTVLPQQDEQMVAERNSLFTECYNLAYTQEAKNKDIPEGGAKATIFLKPYERIDSDAQILRRELQESGLDAIAIDDQVQSYSAIQKWEYLYQAQRAFVESLITIINCDADGKLRAKRIVDYWNRPEYLYLGPDENMHDAMIEWIANFSCKYNYKPGSAFISGKPSLGINHKEYGVTSLGINVYVDAVLRYLNVDPTRDPFTVKMTGGPDGDVAGNEIVNLYRYYPHTARLVALIDGSGTAYDPIGLNLKILVDLFKQGKPIRFYPPQLINPGGLLLDKHTKRCSTPLVQQTLCWRNIDGEVVEDWLSGSDMNYLLRHNVHKIKVDVFIPAGGRPRTLNGANVHDFLDEQGSPTARIIVEGANLYLDAAARHFLEKKGVLIVKDSSANKTGVICSSFEVLSGLTLGDTLFKVHKKELVDEILLRLERCVADEAKLLLSTHQATGHYLTDISDKLSSRINQFFRELLVYLEPLELPNDPQDPLIRCFLNYCLPTLRQFHQKALLREIPMPHKKAIIACYMASQMVYRRGLDWKPSIVDVLPLVLAELPGD